MGKYLANTLTVYEQAKRRVGGDVATIAEIYEQTNEVLIDAPMFEANQVYSNLTPVRGKLPTISPRKINKGAKKSASAVEPVLEQIMLLDTFAEIDEQLIDHETDPEEALMNEINPFIEAAGQTFCENIFYGDPGKDPLQIKGFATRYNKTSMSNVWDMGGASGRTSVWLIEWGKLIVHLIYPRGSESVGIKHTDNGKVRITDDENNPLMAYSHQIKAEFGIAVSDERGVQRLANIATSGDSGTLYAANQMRSLVKAKNKLPHYGRNAIIYCNRDTKSQYDIWAMEKSNGFYTKSDISGEPMTVFQNIPIRMVEKLSSAESAVS